MVTLFKNLNGFLLFELAIFLVVSGLHYHHQRPGPPRPPPRSPPRPPPQRPPPPPNAPRPTTTTTTTSTTTPAPEVEVELEEMINTTTVAPTTVKQAGHPYHAGYPYNGYYNNYYNYNNRQPYDQNQYYGQAQGYYYDGYNTGQSYVAGPPQNPPPAHVTPGPYPTQYPYQHHPPNAQHPATQPPPPAYDHNQHPVQNPHAPQPNVNPQYDYYATPVPTPYYPPVHQNAHQPPPAHQQPQAHQQPPAHQPPPAYQQPPAHQPPPAQQQPPSYQQPQPAVNTYPQPQPAQNTYQQPQPAPIAYQQPQQAQNTYQQPQSDPNAYYDPQYQQPAAYDPVYTAPTQPPQRQNQVNLQPTPSQQRIRIQTQPVSRRRPLTDTSGYSGVQGYAEDINLPAPPTPLTKSPRSQRTESRMQVESPVAVRYSEPVRDSFSRSENVLIQSLDRLEPAVSTVEERYFKADPMSSSRMNEYGIETVSGRSKFVFERKADNIIEKPPGDIAYLKPKATVKAEFNMPKNSEKRQRIPTENQLLEIKKQQLELLKMLLKVQMAKNEASASTKRENPYLKALYEKPGANAKAPEPKQEQPKQEQPKQCPLYKYDVLDNTIEIHTEPGRCKIVIRLPKNGKGKPKVSYLARG